MKETPSLSALMTRKRIWAGGPEKKSKNLLTVSLQISDFSQN